MARRDSKPLVVRVLKGRRSPKGKVHAILVRDPMKPVSLCHIMLEDGRVWKIPTLKGSKVTCKTCRTNIEHIKSSLDSLVS